MLRLHWTKFHLNRWIRHYIRYGPRNVLNCLVGHIHCKKLGSKLTLWKKKSYENNGFLVYVHYKTKFLEICLVVDIHLKFFFIWIFLYCIWFLTFATKYIYGCTLFNFFLKTSKYLFFGVFRLHRGGVCNRSEHFAGWTEFGPGRRKARFFALKNSAHAHPMSSNGPTFQDGPRSGLGFLLLLNGELIQLYSLGQTRAGLGPRKKFGLCLLCLSLPQ